MVVALNRQRAGSSTLAFAIRKTHLGVSPTHVSRVNTKVVSEGAEARVL